MMNSPWFCQKAKFPTVSYGLRWPCAIRYQACWYWAKSGVSAKRRYSKTLHTQKAASLTVKSSRPIRRTFRRRSSESEPALEVADSLGGRTALLVRPSLSVGEAWLDA